MANETACEACQVVESKSVPSFFWRWQHSARNDCCTKEPDHHSTGEIMAKKSFLSFYYKDDSWRVSQVKNLGAVDGQPILSANAWEAIEDKGDDAIKDWIETNMRGRDCLIVLVGARTSGRRWVKHEIRRACERGIGVFGIYIHNLKDAAENQSAKGSDPFSGVAVNNVSISSYAKIYDPPFTTSASVYNHISENISDWIDKAIKLRK